MSDLLKDFLCGLVICIVWVVSPLMTFSYADKKYERSKTKGQIVDE